MAENEEGQEKTEDPTPKRIDDMRKRGMIPQSREVASMAILFSGFLFVYYALDYLFDGIMDVMVAIFRNLDKPFNEHVMDELADLGKSTAAMFTMGLMGLLTFTGAVVGLIQVGWHPSEEALTFNLEKLNPLPGFKRMVSVDALIELAKSFVKLLIVGYIGYRLLEQELGYVLEFPRSAMQSSMAHMGELLYRFTLRCLQWLTVLAMLDLVWQRYSIGQKMKMSKQEVKDENKSREGDQSVKNAMRRAARQRLQQTGIKNVPQADVVVTNPDHFAIALQYRQGKMRAPTVIARGQDRVAELIKSEARRHGIPRVENRLLARTLYKVCKVGDEIPPELYTAVAEVLAFVYRLKHQQAAG